MRIAVETAKPSPGIQWSACARGWIASIAWRPPSRGCQGARKVSRLWLQWARIDVMHPVPKVDILVQTCIVRDPFQARDQPWTGPIVGCVPVRIDCLWAVGDQPLCWTHLTDTVARSCVVVHSTKSGVARAAWCAEGGATHRILNGEDGNAELHSVAERPTRSILCIVVDELEESHAAQCAWIDGLYGRGRWCRRRVRRLHDAAGRNWWCVQCGGRRGGQRSSKKGWRR